MSKTNLAPVDTSEVREEANAVEARCRDLIDKVVKSKAGADEAQELRELLTSSAASKLLRQLRGAMRCAENAIIAEAGTLGISAGLTAIWGAKLQQMRDDMGIESAPALESALIEHVSVCWLRLALAEMCLAGATAGDKSMKVVEHYEKRLSAAQRRYTRACETLARVRRLASRAPLFQVNVTPEGTPASEAIAPR